MSDQRLGTCDDFMAPHTRENCVNHTTWRELPANDKANRMQPTYFVKHPDESFTIAEPQPVLEPTTPAQAEPDWAERALKKLDAEFHIRLIDYSVNEQAEMAALIRKAADETQRFVMASLGIEYDEYTGYTIIAEPEPIEAGESFREAIGEYVKFQNKLAEQAESVESELAALRERVAQLEAGAGGKGSQ